MSLSDSILLSSRSQPTPGAVGGGIKEAVDRFHRILEEQLSRVIPENQVFHHRRDDCILSERNLGVDRNKAAVENNRDVIDGAKVGDLDHLADASGVGGIELADIDCVHIDE